MTGEHGIFRCHTAFNCVAACPKHIDQAEVVEGFKAGAAHRLVQYADDFVILCKLERKAERALEVARQILEGQLRLKVHPEKTRIVHVRDWFDFLGCRFRGRYVTPRAKSLKKFKDRVRELTARHRGKNLKQVLVDLTPVIRGWGNYHQRYNVRQLFHRLDQWTRMRLRTFLEKKKAVRHQNRHIPTRWLEEQGYVSLCSLTGCGKSARPVWAGAGGREASRLPYFTASGRPLRRRPCRPG